MFYLSAEPFEKYGFLSYRFILIYFVCLVITHCNMIKEKLCT